MFCFLFFVSLFLFKRYKLWSVPVLLSFSFANFNGGLGLLGILKSVSEPFLECLLHLDCHDVMEEVRRKSGIDIRNKIFVFAGWGLAQGIAIFLPPTWTPTRWVASSWTPREIRSWSWDFSSTASSCGLSARGCATPSSPHHITGEPPAGKCNYRLFFLLKT